MTFSISNKRAIRHGRAPSAWRMPISRRRAVARDKTRLAVLPQTATNSSSMSAWSTASDIVRKRCGPRGASQNGRTSASTPRLFRGYATARRCMTADTSACA
jgi:hypothetical protein